MTTRYRTRENDVLDKVVFDHYGTAPGALEFVLAANPALRHEGAILSQGQIVHMPALLPVPATPRVRLWS